MGGVFDDYGMPLDFQFASYSDVLEFAFSIHEYENITDVLEVDGLQCGAVDLPYDDHLHEITVPTFYVGAAGGEGGYGLYNLSLLASADKQSMIVGLYPPEWVAVDYGHFDLLMAANAKQLVWEPIFSWLISH